MRSAVGPVSMGMLAGSRQSRKENKKFTFSNILESHHTKSHPMKSKTLLSAFLLSLNFLSAQSFARLDINHLNAGFNAAGDQLSLSPSFTNNVITPYNQMQFTIANLWIGGYDIGHQLHLAGQTYRQTGTDFWAGPLDTVTATCSVAENAFYNKVWKINKTTIDSFRLGQFTVVPNSITSWPGNGNASTNEEHIMAPYIDVNGDGNYNYLDGDYPKIRGDQALWFVYNDNLIGQTHTETNGTPLKVEIKCMAYAVACDDSALANTIFMHFDLINRSTNFYDSTVVGLWTDLDVGGTPNNNIGSDSIASDFYYYSNYFAAGSVLLNRQMGTTMTYNNDFTVTGNPVLATDYFGYMIGKFKDGTPLTYGGTGYGGTNATTFSYTGNPFSGAGWNSSSPVDRRMLGTTKPFNFLPGMDYPIDMAYVVAYDPTLTTFLCVPTLKQRMQAIKTFYNSDQTPCSDNITVVPQQKENINDINAFPNPASSQIILQTTSEKPQAYFIVDLAGQLLIKGMTSGKETVIDIQHLSAGMYFIRVGTNETQQTLPLIKTQ